MAMYAGEVNDNGEWDDDTSLGALLDSKFELLEFKPSEEGADLSEADQKYNKRISFQAIAAAVIEYIKSNMEIKGITVSEGTGEASEVVFTQNNDGTGLVE